jgi:hypothetical protein
MADRKLRQARRDAGLCLRCGADREQGSARLNCAACAAKLRENVRAYRQRHPEKVNACNKEVREAWRQKRQAERRAAGRCLRCGGARAGTGGLLCPTCRQKQHRWEADFRQRERNKASGGRYEVPPWPVGAAVPGLEGGGRRYRIGLTIPARIALGKILDRYKEKERAVGRAPKTHQISRLVREAIRIWRRSPCPKRPEGDVWVVEMISITLDAPTERIVRWQAADYLERNVSATLRAILINSVPPTVIGAVARRPRDDSF